MTNCCIKRSTAWSRFVEKITTKRTRIKFEGYDEGYHIPTYFVTNRPWWKIVLWMKRLPNRTYRYFKPYNIVTFNKIIIPSFQIPVEELQKYNYDIRDIFSTQPMKEDPRDDKKRTD